MFQYWSVTSHGKELWPKHLLFEFLFQVQSKVSLKYDSWHKEVVSKFGSMLGTEMQDFHGQVSKVSVQKLCAEDNVAQIQIILKKKASCGVKIIANCFPVWA
jgi:hypothetical protein